MRARTMGVFLTAGLAAGLMAIPAQAAIAASTILVSQSSGGVQGNDMSGRFSRPAISGDGQVTAFDSMADNLVPADTNHNVDVFVHDAATGETERVSVSTAGAQANEDSQSPTVDQTGRARGVRHLGQQPRSKTGTRLMDVFVRDRVAGQTTWRAPRRTGRPGTPRASAPPSLPTAGTWRSFRRLEPGPRRHEPRSGRLRP